MAPNEIYQYSIVSALMDGVAENGLPISTLLSHGDHGLGTFRHMVGELIVVDGVAYQMKSDGKITAVDVDPKADVITPFAMNTHFQAKKVTEAVLESKAATYDVISSMVPEAPNTYLSIRIEGVFKSVTYRTVGGQCRPHEGLIEVGARQTSRTFENVEGTIIGFRSPKYMENVSVAGDHLHFISADKTKGGHLLGLASEGKVKVEVAPALKFHLELPENDEEFNVAPLKADAAAVALVEG